MEKPAIAAKKSAQAKFDAEEATVQQTVSEEERLTAELEFNRIDYNNDGDLTTEEVNARARDIIFFELF